MRLRKPKPGIYLEGQVGKRLTLSELRKQLDRAKFEERAANEDVQKQKSEDVRRLEAKLAQRLASLCWFK